MIFKTKSSHYFSALIHSGDNVFERVARGTDFTKLWKIEDSRARNQWPLRTQTSGRL